MRFATLFHNHLQPFTFKGVLDFRRQYACKGLFKKLAPRRLIRTAFPYQLTGAIGIQLTDTMTTTGRKLVGLVLSGSNIGTILVIAFAVCFPEKQLKLQTHQKPHKKMAPRVGFEPTADRLTADCSAAELSRNKKRWCRKRDLNPRPDDYKSTALPAVLFRLD